MPRNFENRTLKLQICGALLFRTALTGCDSRTFEKKGTAAAGESNAGDYESSPGQVPRPEISGGVHQNRRRTARLRTEGPVENREDAGSVDHKGRQTP
jgi:hypothetical protein